MGGEGSGRRQSVETIIKQSQPVVTPVGDSMWLPNYSGVQDAALKTAVPLSAGGGGITTESDPIFMSLSGSFLTAETDPNFAALSGSLPYLLITSSGSLAYIPTTDYPDFELSGSPTFMTLSGTITPKSHALNSHTQGNNKIFWSDHDGSLQELSVPGAATTFLTGDGDSHANFVQVNHTSLSNIGTTTHANLDIRYTEFAILSGEYALTSGAYIAHAADTTDPHGATLTQTNFLVTSGATTADLTASGTALFRNILIGTETSGALTASNYVQGTIYLKYT